jgi:hypothetical protein
VDLYLAKNDEPGELIKGPALGPAQRGQRTLPGIEFQNAPASLAADPAARFKLVAFVRRSASLERLGACRRRQNAGVQAG